MVEDGFRLSYSVTKANTNIIDMLTGNTLSLVNNVIVTGTLDKDIVVNHLKNLTEAAMRATRRYGLINRHGDSSKNMLIIREDKHNEWTVSFDGSGCTIVNGVITTYRGFDYTAFLREVNRLYANIVNQTVPLNPKKNIVRRIADVGLLVWVYDGHSVVCYEDNVMGNYMLNCLIDGFHYDSVIVSTSRQNDITYILNNKLEEIIHFPLDESIESYYPCDDEAF